MALSFLHRASCCRAIQLIQLTTAAHDRLHVALEGQAVWPVRRSSCLTLALPSVVVADIA